MAYYVAHGSKKRKFKTAKGAKWHQKRFGGRLVKKAAAKRKAKRNPKGHTYRPRVKRKGGKWFTGARGILKGQRVNPGRKRRK